MSSAKTARWLDLIAYLLQHRYPVTREDIYANIQGYSNGPPSPERRRGQGDGVEPPSPNGRWGHGDEAPERRRGQGDGVDAAETTRRMFERDKDELRTLGIQIETLPIPDAKGDEPATGYRLRPGDFYLPMLELHEPSAIVAHRPYQGLARIQVSREDLALLDRATQLVAQRIESPLGKFTAAARRKLEFDLPLPTAAVERVLAARLDDDATKALEVLQRAVAERIAVKCRYHSIGRDEETLRVIEPYGLFFNWGRWYCAARARDRDAMRVFRVDRMRDVALEKGKSAAFTVPQDFSIRSYLDRAPWELSGKDQVPVRVRFAFPESRWVQAQGTGVVIEPLTEDGGAVLEFQVRDPSPFLRWLLTFRRHVEVLEPKSMTVQLDELRRQVAALYA